MEYVFISLVGLLFWAIILQSIISHSTRTKERTIIEKKQLSMLTAIATKLGVTDEEVNSILNSPKG